MPQPNPRRHVFVNEIPALNIVNRTTVWIGRTVWEGNQRRRMTSKVMPPTGCFSQELKYNTQTYEIGVRKGSIWYCNGNVGETVHFGNTGDLAVARLRAVSRFSANTGFAETLAETPSSVRLIGRRATTIYQILNLAGRGLFRQAGARLLSATGYNVSNRSIKRLEKRFSEAKAYDSRRATSFWLETQFGFLPLFQSVYDSLQEFGRSETVRRSKATDGSRGFHIYGAVRNQRTETLSSLGLTNPASLAWDLLPFSFVIDWFLPIGTILRWYGSGMGLEARYACSTDKWGQVDTARGIFYRRLTNYRRTPVSIPTTVQLLSAGPRSHGLWTAVTAVSLINALR